MEKIVQLLQSKVIPWTTQIAERRLIVARPVMRAGEFPPGVTVSPQPIKGKRTILKNRRKHANQRLHIAEWPEANLHEITLPKLACIVSGTADYLLGKYCMHCGEGNFILIPPRTPHQCKGPFLQGERLQNGSCSLLQTYAYSHGIFVWQSRSQNGQHINDFTRNYLILNMAAVKIFNLLMEEAVEGKGNFEIACNGLLSAFFTILAREIEEGHYMHPGPKANYATSVTPSAGFAEQVQEYVTANCHKPLKLTDVAAQMYMSVSQFTRRMRRETGVTFVEMLTAARIERAKEMLRETDWTFTAISNLLAFKSSSYFQDLFRRRVGCTPAQYRHQSTLAGIYPRGRED